MFACFSIPRITIALLWAAGVGVVSTSSRAERVIFVDQSAVGLDDGTSWSNAFLDVQDALYDAKTHGGCPCDIWVARGNYKPDRGSVDRTLAFELASGIAIYGGFGGWEDCRDQSDPAGNPTILSGDLLDDDEDFQSESISGCCTSEVCVDVACRESVIKQDPTCAQLWRDRCADAALVFCCDLCRPTLCDNAFNVVRAVETDESAILNGLIIERGDARSAPVAGGGLYALFSRLSVSKCNFRFNNAFVGAGIEAIGGPPTVTDTLFINNGSPLNYSAAVEDHSHDDGGIVMKDCIFQENYAGVVLHGGISPVERCQFIRNKHYALFNTGGRSDQYRDIKNCLFEENFHTAVTSSALLRFTNCSFLGNWEPAYGGAISMYHSGNAVLINCLLSGNRAGRDETSPDGAYPGWGAAFDGSGEGVDYFFNCTFVNNKAESLGGAGIASSGGIYLENCLFWGNAGSDGPTQFAQISPYDYNVVANYSIVQGWSGSFGGVGSSGIDPFLFDPLGPDGIGGTLDDNARLLPNSPAINAGDADNSQIPSDERDLDGHSRILCGRVDIGAYEFGIGDVTCDRRVGIADAIEFSSCTMAPNPQPMSWSDPLSPCASFDFDGDADVDLRDFREFSNLLTTPAPDFRRAPLRAIP